MIIHSKSIDYSRPLWKDFQRESLKKSADRYKNKIGICSNCIMRIISNCNRMWDLVLYICCPKCICPWGKTGRHSCQMWNKVCLCIKYEPNNSMGGQPFCKDFQVTLAGSRSAECKLLLLFILSQVVGRFKIYIEYFLKYFILTF